MWRRSGRFWLVLAGFFWAGFSAGYGEDLNREEILREVLALEQTLTELKQDLEALSNLNKSLQEELRIYKTGWIELTKAWERERALSSELQKSLERLKTDWIELRLSYEKEKSRAQTLSWILIGLAGLGGIGILGSLVF